MIVLTSSQNKGDIDRATELGVHSYWVKPVGLENLFDLFRTLQMYWVILKKTPESPDS